MTIVRMAQGSPEWHEHRRKYRNASETPVVLGVSPWKTPYQLWQLKLGLIEQEVSLAMQRGTELEPVARAAYEKRTGRIMQALVVVDGEYSASLDAMTLGGERIAEIKCPVKGKESTLWKMVEIGQLPEHYQWQVEHQLMVTKAAVADVFVFDGADGVLLEVAPDAGSWPRIHEAWDKFAAFIASKTAPPLSDRDTRIRDDPDWLSAAAAYLELRAAHDELGTKLDDAKTRLVGLASHAKEQGGGTSVTRVWKRGNVDFKRVPQLSGVDLDAYRGAAKEEVRVVVQRVAATLVDGRPRLPSP
jgi:putative phage-type endonuclease